MKVCVDPMKMCVCVCVFVCVCVIVVVSVNVSEITIVYINALVNNKIKNYTHTLKHKVT